MFPRKDPGDREGSAAAVTDHPERSSAVVAEGGWGWLALLRFGLALTMAGYALTYRAAEGHPAPRYAVPSAVSIAMLVLALGVAQSLPRFRSSRPAAVVFFALSAIAVLGTLGLFAFDPRRYLLALLVVVQAEGGVVLGFPWSLVAWAATTLGYLAVEALSAASTGSTAHPIEAGLRIGVGLLLSLGGAFLSDELSGERARGAAERELELHRLQQAEAKYRLLVEQTPVITYIDAVDQNSTALYVSPRVEDVLGYSPEEWTSDPELWTRLLHPDDREQTIEEHARTNSTGEPFRAEYRLIARDGRAIWVQDEAFLLRDAAGEPRFWQGVMVDITERKQAEEQIAFLAYHDKLTGLPNRALFEEVLDLALARARRSDLAVAVLYMDLDNFKLVNDSLGHAAGDQLLREMATRLTRSVRESDVVARQGGDEFLVLLADLEGALGDDRRPRVVGLAEIVAMRIEEDVRRPFVLSGTEFFVSGSIGISVFPMGARDAKALLKQADAAMYRSKRSAPGGHAVFTGDSGDPLNKLSLATRLRKAVDEEEAWVLQYQPVVDLKERRMVGVEALIRWRQPGGELVAPGEFIPLAEEMGLIGKIGDWVLEEICRQARAWQQEGMRFHVSFNMSPRQLWQPDMAESVLSVIESSGLDPESVVVEITETAAMTDPERTHRVLGAMHRGGIRLALDDFGTGYSSLSRLKNLPVDVLKIDRPFLRDVPRDPEARSMLKAVIGLALSLDMQPLAEGVEREDQRSFLLEHGCSLGQGFLFSRAVNAEEIPARFRDGFVLVDERKAAG
jgi:diguanylate cyclase (GGDEF)-like protein/PAS domain S-box-containing protein